MIICTVCGEANDELLTVCSRCHSFLQAKVDALDLFSTAWGLMERPGQTFRRIVLSRHKNYIFLLAGVAGVGVVFALLQALRAGTRFGSIGLVFAAGPLIGIPFGILLLWVVAMISRVAGLAVGGKGTLRNLRAVWAYAALPFIAAVLILLPVKLAIFGIYLFDPNPAPSVINPVLYYVLLGLDTLALLLTAVWSVFGLSTSMGISKMRALIPAAVVAAGFAAGFLVAASQ